VTTPPRPPSASPLAHVGLDVGGTKTHIRAAHADGTITDVVHSSSRWRHGTLFSDVAGNLARLADLVASLGEITASSVVAAGVHDCDTDAQMDAAAQALRARLGCRVVVVNDALLLRYATPERSTIEMIVGTGAIVSGTTVAGERVTADGHGWPVGDRGSAPDLVHAAVVAALEAADRGDADSDPLFPAVRAAFAAEDAATLALHARSDLDPARWGGFAHVVFDAWHAGSAAAHAIVTSRARVLAQQIARLRERGAAATTVVAAGGVLVNQPRYEEAVRRHLEAEAPEMRFVVVRTPPAVGALALAGELATAAA
jgi:N-acetylglucosamine kinase-like BadF-type ATPase